MAGHLDVSGSFFLMLAIYLLLRGNQRWAAISLGAAGLTKGFALLLLPLFVRRCGKRLLAVMALALLYLGLPLWVYLPMYLHGMQQYLGTVHVNASLFSLLDSALALVTNRHFNIVSKISDITILTAVGWSIWTKPVHYEEVVRRAIIVLAACLLVVPTLFPWYLVWILPLVVIYKPKPSVAFLCLAGTVNFVYIYYIADAVLWWVPVLEYTPVYILLYWEWKRGYWRPADLEGGSAVVSEIASTGALGAVESDDTYGDDATW